MQKLTRNVYSALTLQSRQFYCKQVEYIPTIFNMDYEGTPTIRPATEFDVEKDTGALREALSATETNEQVIIDIVTALSNEQRQTLKEHYNTTLERDLIADLKSKLSVGCADVILALMMPTYTFLAKILHNALHDEDKEKMEYVIIDIFLPLGSEFHSNICMPYYEMYNVLYMEDIQNMVKGDYQQIMVTCASMIRDDANVRDRPTAKDYAERVIAASKGDVYPTLKVFHTLLCKFSFATCLLFFEEYEKLTGRSIEEAIKRGTKERADVLLSFVECIQNVPAYYATRLFKAMDGAGTDDTSLIRIIISRSEIDLGNIKEEFERLYNRSLVSAVKSETSGDYKRALCGIIGEDIGEE